MISSLPYVNRVVYHIQTKRGIQLTPDEIHDIMYGITDYGLACIKQSNKENKQLQNEILQQAKVSRFINEMKKYIKENDL